MSDGVTRGGMSTSPIATVTFGGDENAMAEAFREQVRSERRATWVIAITLLAFFGVIAVGTMKLTPTGGRVIDATVLGFGTFPTELGDRPLMTVRLKNGVERQLFVDKIVARNCTRGSKVQLLDGNTIRLAARGCAPN